MAKSKKTSPKKGDKKNKPSSKPAAGAGDMPPLEASRAEAVLTKLLAQHPPITNAQRAAYSALVEPAQADELGRRTRAADVRDDAVRWSIQMDETLRAYPGALRRYSPARFVHYLECVRGLHETIRTEANKRAKVDTARGAAEIERGAALDARKELESALRTFAGRRSAERDDLKSALGLTDTAENLGKSITALAALGQRWLSRDDETSKLLAAEAGLTLDVIQSATQAAAVLQAASADAMVEGRARANDTPPVNRAEGRVLFEMFEARRIWNEANERVGLVEKLTPSASIRHVFGRTPRGEDAGDAPEAGGSAEPGAAPPA